MAVLVVKRLGELVLTLLVTSFLLFGALYLVPGGPLAYLVRGRAADAATIARIKAEYNLNESFFPRYWDFVSGLFRGHLGVSLVSHESTWDLISPRLEVSLTLVILATIEVVFFGVLLGALAGLSNKSTDSLITIGATIGVGIPPFASAAALISVLAVGLGWFPVSGGGAGFVDILRHVFLPSIALAIGSIAYMIRLTRAAVIQEKSLEYVDAARARGLSTQRIVRVHILKNSTPSILTAGGVSFVGLLASEVVVESAFGINGIGSLLVSSVTAKDFAVVQVLVLMYVTLFMLINTVTDVIAYRVDPRLAVEETSS